MRAAVPVVLALFLLSDTTTSAAPAAPDLARKARQILQEKCHRCHGRDGANEGGFNYILNVRQLIQRKKVIPGKPAASKLYKRLISADDPMPPAEEKVRPGKEDLVILRQWIEAGAPDAEPVPPVRRFLTRADVLRIIRTDLEGVPERDRRFTRYFTLTHLHNAGLSADEMQSFRHGLTKLVNSLSWGKNITTPRAIDRDRTVFRIDLRDYQWNEKVWEAVLALNPYGVSLDSEDGKVCIEATRCRLPWVRGDWFVAAAARPPLYHDVLQLPQTERELEKMLRVDVAEDIRLERVVRAGFNGSGVSRNNRLIERHEAGSVVYWKSYDFRTNTGRYNLFAHPLGPGDDEGQFQHDGGEIIFNLPNGLQGYFLTDARGRRLDKGPTAIVSDPRRPDRAVENGISCMSCHARGIIEKADQVRDHVRKSAGVFAKGDADTILALYPPAEKLRDLMRKDARRFQQAVAKTGAPLSRTEPVAALALRFEAEMDLNLVAAEAGVRPAELLHALDRSLPLAKLLGSLKVEGGTVQRQVFVDAFGELIGELKLGKHLPPRSVAYGRLMREGDALLQKGDTAGALRTFDRALELEPANPWGHVARGDAHRIARNYTKALACYREALRLEPTLVHAWNNRGLTHHLRGDHDLALADFTEALRRDPRFSAAYFNRGSTHYARADLDKAIADYTEVLRLDPKSAVAHNNRGFAFYDKDDYDQALADFTRAVELDSKFAVAFNNRGLTYNRKKDYDRAIADFTRAIALDAKFAKAYYNRGLAYKLKGDEARAEADRAKALRLDPSLDKE